MFLTSLVLSSFLPPQVASAGRVDPPASVSGSWMAGRAVHRAVFEDEQRALLESLRARGVVRWLEDYGDRVVAGLDETLAGGSAALQALDLEWQDEQDLILFQRAVIDSVDAERAFAGFEADEVVGRAFGENLPTEERLYLVQYRAPIREEWRLALEESGARILQYVPFNAYVVELEPGEVGAFHAWSRGVPELTHVGVYETALRLQPGAAALVRESNVPAKVLLQVVAGPAADSVLAALRPLLDEEPYTWGVGPYLNVECRLHPAYFRWMASRPGVFALQLFGERERFDEVQGQIVANNVSGAAPTGPGYLAWLASKGFDASQFGSFAVNVADDCMSLTGHPDLPASRIAFSANPSGQTGLEGGHGFLNAQIVGGMNSGSTTADEDGLGFNYGLGIAPFARVGTTAIFGTTPTSPDVWESSAYDLGARISSNSWGISGSVTYDIFSQGYDYLTRDVKGTSTAGNQEYTFVFAVGNAGAASTIASPSNAKNVISVGSSEGVRGGTDGCMTGPTQADDLRDLADHSSRGPVGPFDTRFKPDLCAPGTHIQAGVPQSSYPPMTPSICDDYYPALQTLYSWSTGTSHACPAVAGGAALVRQWFLNGGRPAPSPAMTKAVLVNSAQYMTGASANDTLPSSNQGMGRLSLERAFDSVPRLLVDQTRVLGANGKKFVLGPDINGYLAAADVTKPIRITLVWTDAPGASTAAPWVNDLDLIVRVDGVNYKGNVFSGESSVAAGAFDRRNNVESVYLPAGTSDSLRITVRAWNVSGDGVPGNADATDQDFALVAYNVRRYPWPPVSYNGWIQPF